MGIFIKNPETERVVREVAALRGDTITGVIDALAREALAREALAREALAREAPAPLHRKRTLEEMRAATAEFRRATGLDQEPKPLRPFIKADWDALWPTGIPEIDDA
jgi:antitoxin VapB